MSEHTVAILAADLNITLEQANALWLKTRQAVFKSLQQGAAVDLGFAYLMPGIKASRRRHDFGTGGTIVTPEQRTLKMHIPPHVKGVLEGHSELSPYVWLTRSQLKGLRPEEMDGLRRAGTDYYQLKGVTV
jgi:hypothetical protein